jgi:hypothetical protein
VAIPTKRNSVGISIAQKAANVGTALETLRNSGDFQAEYSVTVAVMFQITTTSECRLGGCASSLSREEKEQRLFVFREGEERDYTCWPPLMWISAPLT